MDVVTKCHDIIQSIEIDSTKLLHEIRCLSIISRTRGEAFLLKCIGRAEISETPYYSFFPKKTIDNDFFIPIEIYLHLM